MELVVNVWGNVYEICQPVQGEAAAIIWAL